MGSKHWKTTVYKAVVLSIYLNNSSLPSLLVYTQTFSQAMLQHKLNVTNDHVIDVKFPEQSFWKRNCLREASWKWKVKSSPTSYYIVNWTLMSRRSDSKARHEAGFLTLDAVHKDDNHQRPIQFRFDGYGLSPVILIFLKNTRRRLDK